MVAPHPSLADAKQAARAAARTRPGEPDPAADQAIRDVLLSLLPDAGAVAAVWPLPGEPDLRPLLHHLHATGRIVLLPQTPPRGLPLAFHVWHPAAAMQAGRFGTFHPEGPGHRPDVVLVPLLAFDRSGVRLGHGGGYYDRTLAGLPGVLAIGFARACQEVERLPAGAHDVRLRVVVTELGVQELGSKEALLF